MWGIPVPSRVPSGGGSGWGSVIRRGSGVPADALGNLGDRYFDTAAQRWYLKRWVGNFSGVDSIANPKPYFGATGPFSFEILINAPAAVATYSTVMTGASAMGGTVALQENGTDPYIAFVQPTVGSFLVSSSRVFDNTWHKVVGSRDAGGVYSLSVDGNAPVTATPSLAVGPVSFSIGAFVGGITQQFVGKLARVKAAGFGNTLKWDISEGSGLIVSDSSGNGNNGTISDGSPATFWLQTWVPMDLL